jgi:glycosyltransferase involved in cell wall biosynthesis
VKSISVVAQPKLSVVVASQNARASVGDCLRALEKQHHNGDLEIIVIDNSTDETADIVKRDFPAVKFVAAEKSKLIPELWGIGINESAGDFVALTTSHFVPAATWTREIIKAHELERHAGIGGAIENEPRAGLVSWAIYFCRYSPYMLPFGETEVEDFAADNASYKRRELERVSDAMRDGFWETFVHREMLKKRMSLVKSPQIVVYHQKSFSFVGFINQRFWHGRQFGGARAARISGARRLMMILLSPLIPLVYLSRITRRVFAKKRNVGFFLASLPILILFLLSWSLGELSGYLWSGERK